MMARFVGHLHADFDGWKPMFASFESLAEALAVAQIDEPVDLNVTNDGLVFDGHTIARFTQSGVVDGTIHFAALPTFRMPIFAQEICRLAPGVKVRWQGGWPHFSASDGDNHEAPNPDPVTGERVLA